MRAYFLSIVVFCGLAVQLLEASDMKILTGNEFVVIGIEARTSNAREATADRVIPKQWDEVLQNGLLSRIPNRMDSTIIALYTDYESDEHGPYTYVLGAKVAAVSKIPQGMVARRVPAGRYAIFTSDRGPVAEVGLNTWKRIWALPQSNPEIHRNYKTDFEVYDQRAADPKNAQIDIYVGIK